MWTVYKITHTESGDGYFGITKRSPPSRWAEHVHDSRRKRGNRRAFLHNAIRQYGADAFTFEVVRTVATREEACDIERAMIAEFQTMRPRGFNLTSGGESTVGTKHSDETRAKNKARWEDPAFKGNTLVGLRRNARWTGPDAERHKQDAAKRMSERNKQNWRDPDYAAHTVEALRNREVSDETRAKVSVAMKKRSADGWKFPPRSREERSATTKAYYAANPKPPESDETKRRKSEANLAYWKRRRAAAAAGEIERVGHKPHANSDETKRKISAGLTLAYQEGRRVRGAQALPP